MATRSFSPRSTALASKISVVALEPVFANGAEDVEIERVFQSHGAVRHVGRDAQHLALAHHHLLALEFELQRPFENVRELLALMMVLRHHRSLGEENLRHHGLIAGDDLARDGLAENLFFHLVPRVEFHCRYRYQKPQPLYMPG